MRTIQDFETLSQTDLRRDAIEIADAGYIAVHTGSALERKLKIENNVLYMGTAVYPLANRRIFFIGIGKCAPSAAESIEKLFGDRLTAGIVLSVASPEHHTLSKIEMFIGTHPLPSEINEKATKRIVTLLSGCEESDLVIMLISGGGSTLLCLHETPMTCLDESILFVELTKQGATIQDINTVRKHTSRARGGGLAKIAYPAEVLSLIVSDVPGNDIEYIASGPTVKDTSTVADAKVILSRYAIATSATLNFIETPKEERYFKRVTNTLFLTNKDALLAMKNTAEKRGYAVTIVDDHISGEARSIGQAVAEKLHATPPKTVLLYAGESTVTLGAHTGPGGRNQEIALSALTTLRGDELVLPFASDGHDNTNHAGAIADSVTREHAESHGLSVHESLENHSSYDFFTKTGDALRTGYTGANVSDLIIAIKN